MIDELNLDIGVADILEYAGWAAIVVTILSTLLTMRRARKWKPVGTRLVVTAAIGSAITLGSLLWTHRENAWPAPTVAVAAVGLIAGWLTATGLDVRRSRLGAVAKRSALWAAVWGGGLITIQAASVLNEVSLLAPAVLGVGIGTGAILGVGIRLLAKKRKLPGSSKVPKVCPACGRPVATEAGECAWCRRAASHQCRQCGARLQAEARFCSRCGAAVVQPARR